MSKRRKIKDLLKQLKVLTPGALVRWDVLVAVIEILIEKLKQGMGYEHTWVRPWELKEYEIRSVTAHKTIGMFYKLRIVRPLDRRTGRIIPPEIQVSDNGIKIIRKELGVWDEIFKLTVGYILDRSALQVLRQRLDELDRLIKRSNEKQTKSQSSLM